MVDDDDSGVFTAGAIVTVTVRLIRRDSGDVYTNLLRSNAPENAGEQDNKKAAAANNNVKKVISEEESLKMLLGSVSRSCVLTFTMDLMRFNANLFVCEDESKNVAQVLVDHKFEIILLQWI